ncbi:MAG: hypothetical protein ACN6OC_12850 [Alcaligenes sp.]
MDLQAAYPALPTYGQQKLQHALERKDLGSCPLGIVGNLRFAMEEGGTARATRLGVRLSDLRRSFAHAWAVLKDRFTCAPSEARAQRKELMQVRKHSRHVGNVLGCLTAPTNDAAALSKLARNLAQLGELSKGRLASLKGGEESLRFYLDELSDADLIALYNGVLGQPAARKAVLEQIPKDSLAAERQASDVLKQIEDALIPRFQRQVVCKPLGEIAALLSASPVNGAQLEKALTSLAWGLRQFESSRASSTGRGDGDALDSYFQCLQEGESKALLNRLLSVNLDAGRQALASFSVIWPSHRAEIMMDRISQSVYGEIHARAKPELQQLKGKLDKAVRDNDLPAASGVLLELNALVDRNLQAYRKFPDETADDVCDLIGIGMNLFRDAASNPVHPLNAASLKKLPDGVLLNLRRVPHLHVLGLDLDRQALNEAGLARVRAHVKEYTKAAKHMPQERLEWLRLMKQAQAQLALSIIDEDSAQMRAALRYIDLSLSKPAKKQAPPKETIQAREGIRRIDTPLDPKAPMDDAQVLSRFAQHVQLLENLFMGRSAGRNGKADPRSFRLQDLSDQELLAIYRGLRERDLRKFAWGALLSMMSPPAARRASEAIMEIENVLRPSLIRQFAHEIQARKDSRRKT